VKHEKLKNVQKVKKCKIVNYFDPMYYVMLQKNTIERWIFFLCYIFKSFPLLRGYKCNLGLSFAQIVQSNEKRQQRSSKKHDTARWKRVFQDANGKPCPIRIRIRTKDKNKIAATRRRV
jgi:hypothetical protein